jgi:hypothetical protein
LLGILACLHVLLAFLPRLLTKFCLSLACTFAQPSKEQFLQLCSLKTYERRVGQLVHGGLDITQAVIDFGLTRRQITYWRDKAADPTLHAADWGEAKNRKYTPHLHSFVEDVLFGLIEKFPNESVARYEELMRSYGVLDAKESRITRCLCRWHWSIQKIYHVQKQKFSARNVLRTVDHR